MPGWRKLLDQMVADSDTRAYTDDDAAKVLLQLGFEDKGGKGSHRRFRIEIQDPTNPDAKRGVIVGLVQRGKGTLNPVYILKMVEVLRANDLLPG